jgi:hypothetical protein
VFAVIFLSVVVVLAFICWLVLSILDLKHAVKNMHVYHERLSDRITKESGDLFQLRMNIEKATKL